jgi:hypothetical protein
MKIYQGEDLGIFNLSSEWNRPLATDARCEEILCITTTRRYISEDGILLHSHRRRDLKRIMPQGADASWRQVRGPVSSMVCQATCASVDSRSLEHIGTVVDVV